MHGTGKGACSMGILATNPSTVELGMLIAFGITGYLMRCWDYPIAPMIVDLILGPMTESQFRREHQISLGNSLVFFRHSGSAALLDLAFIALVALLVFKGLRCFSGEDSC